MEIFREDPVRVPHELDPLRHPTVGLRPRGFWGTFTNAFEFGVSEVNSRWASLFDDERSEVITFPEFQEVTGDRGLEWFPGMTRSQVQHRMMMQDYQEYNSQFKGNVLAEFVGMSLPFAYDVVTLATLPVGGKAFTMASKAPTLRGMLALSAKGGAQVGMASFPLEIGVQQAAYGEIDPMMLGAATLAPVVVSPLMGLAGRGMRRAMSRDNAELAARLTADEPENFSNVLHALEREADLPPPPQYPDIGPPAAPSARAQEIFVDYQGDASQFVRDLGRQTPQAMQKAAELGIDVNHPAIRDLISRYARTTVRENDGPRLDTLFDFRAALAGRASPEQLDRLRTANMLPDVEAARAAMARSPGARGLEDVYALRVAEAREGELARRMSPAYEELRLAYDTDPVARTAEQRITIRDFERHGGDRLQAQKLNQLEAEYDAATLRFADLDAELKARRGRPPKRLVEERAQAETVRKELWDQMEAQREALRNIQDDVPLEDIMAAIDASFLDRPNPANEVRPAQPETQTTRQEAAGRMERARTSDEELEAIEQWARQNDVDVEDVRVLMDELETRVVNC